MIGALVAKRYAVLRATKANGYSQEERMQAATMLRSAYSVSEITRRIKAALEGDAALRNVWVSGEVSNWFRSRAGHCYFTLKDAQTTIRAVLWRATAEDRLGAETLAMIEPDAYLLRRYDAPGRTPIWLYVGVYASRAGYGKGAHDPEVCYPAQGWEIMQSELFDVPLMDGNTLATRHLEAYQGLAKESVLYWFQPAERWPAQAATEQLLRVLDAARGHPQYAFVRLSGPTDGGPTAVRDLAEFAAEIAASIRTVVDEVGSAGETGAPG